VSTFSLGSPAQTHASRRKITLPAKDTFDRALVIVQQYLRNDPKRLESLDAIQATTLDDVLHVVAAAQKRYEDKRSDSKVHTCITNFSKRICHYGNVMDVMVQQSPEYVALAWGAMKLLFGVGTRSASGAS
jgi:hypothetical protein